MPKDKVRQKEKIIAIIKNEKGGKKIMTIGVEKYNVFAIIKDKFGKIKQIIKAENIVTDAGDIYYAQQGANETPTNAFIDCVLGTGSIAAAKGDDYSDMTVIAGSPKAPTATYPKANDTDTDNTGKAVDSVTWMYEWTGADFNNAAIREGMISITSATGTDPLLTRWVWGAAFEKTATDTLTLFVNHNFLGI